MTTEKPRIRTIQFFLGYCESERVAGVTVSREKSKGFKTARGAILQFLRDCKEILQKGKTITKDCCTRSKKRKETYCSKCGTYLNGSPSVEDDDLIEFIRTLDGDLDEIGMETIDSLETMGWSLGGIREGDWAVVRGMDYLIRGEYPSCYSISRMTVQNYRMLKNGKPLRI